MIHVKVGQAPVILCLPHSGQYVPSVVNACFAPYGKLQMDQSWRLEQIFDLPENLDVTIISTSVSRYVVDVDKPLAPSANAQPFELLCPITTFDHKNIYLEGEAPGSIEIEQRRLIYYDPFHEALAHEIKRLRELHKDIVVIDCQSVRSRFRGPEFGDIPLINVATAEKTSCDPELPKIVVKSFEGLAHYSASIDGPFRGGEILRRHARPEDGIHALSLIIAQRGYLRFETPPFEPDRDKLELITAFTQLMTSSLILWACGEYALLQQEMVEDPAYPAMAQSA